MIAIARGVAAVVSLLTGERRELARTLLTSRSYAEAGLALGLLAEETRERDLIDLVNLREILAEIPATPMPMAVDFATLARVVSLHRDGNAWASDDDGFAIHLIGEGNMCYDLVVKTDEATAYWTQHGEDSPFVHPKALDIVLERPQVLERVVGVVKAMGMPFNPPFYLSLDDFRLEHAEDTMDDLLNGLF